MKIFSVHSVMVTKLSDSPLAFYIQAQGLVASTGWTNPKLDNSADPDPDDRIYDFIFEAERPSGVSLPVLNSIQATITIQPKSDVDAVIVSSRTNSITIHSSQFMTLDSKTGQITTLAIGEEASPNSPTPEDRTEFAANTSRKPTTLAIGEEGHYPKLVVGEHQLPTYKFGENGPITDIRVEDIVPWKLPHKRPMTGPSGEVQPDPVPDYRDDDRVGGPFGSFTSNSKYRY